MPEPVADPAVSSAVSSWMTQQAPQRTVGSGDKDVAIAVNSWIGSQAASPNLPPEHRIHYFLQDQANQGKTFDEMAPAYKEQFGEQADPTPVKNTYDSLREHAYYRDKEPSLVEHAMLRSVPFQSAIGTFGMELEYKDAKARTAAGTPRGAERTAVGTGHDSDAKVIARYERLQELQAEQEKTTGGAVRSGLAHFPAVVGEYWLTGGIANAAKALPAAARIAETSPRLAKVLGITAKVAPEAGAEAATEAPSLWSLAGLRNIGTKEGAKTLAAQGGGALVRNQVQTAAAPSTYLPEAGKSANQQGGEWSDAKNLGKAYAVASVQNAVYAKIGPVGEAIPGKGFAPEFGRFGTRVGVGLMTQQVLDVLHGVADKDAGYGAIGDLLKGNVDEATKKFVVQLATFAAFSSMHVGQAPPERPVAPAVETRPDVTGQPPAGPTAPGSPRVGPQPGPAEPGAAGKPGAEAPPGGPLFDKFTDALKFMQKKRIKQGVAVRIFSDFRDQLIDLESRKPNFTEEDAVNLFKGQDDGPIKDFAEELARAYSRVPATDPGEPPPAAKPAAPAPVPEAPPADARVANPELPAATPVAETGRPVSPPEPPTPAAPKTAVELWGDVPAADQKSLAKQLGLSPAGLAKLLPKRPDLQAVVRAYHEQVLGGKPPESPPTPPAPPEPPAKAPKPESVTLSTRRIDRHYDPEQKKTVQFNVHDFFDQDGKRLGDARIVERDGGKNVHVEWVGMEGARAGSLADVIGSRNAKSLLKQLAEQYPDAETVSGVRTKVDRGIERQTDKIDLDKYRNQDSPRAVHKRLERSLRTTGEVDPAIKDPAYKDAWDLITENYRHDMPLGERIDRFMDAVKDHAAHGWRTALGHHFDKAYTPKPGLAARRPKPGFPEPTRGESAIPLPGRVESRPVNARPNVSPPAAKLAGPPIPFTERAVRRVSEIAKSAGLTDRQMSDLLPFLDGKMMPEIAAGRGVSKQAVEQMLLRAFANLQAEFPDKAIDFATAADAALASRGRGLLEKIQANAGGRKIRTVAKSDLTTVKEEGEDFGGDGWKESQNKLKSLEAKLIQLIGLNKEGKLSNEKLVSQATRIQAQIEKIEAGGRGANAPLEPDREAPRPGGVAGPSPGLVKTKRSGPAPGATGPGQAVVQGPRGPSGQAPAAPAPAPAGHRAAESSGVEIGRDDVLSQPLYPEALAIAKALPKGRTPAIDAALDRLPDHEIDYILDQFDYGFRPPTKAKKIAFIKEAFDERGEVRSRDQSALAPRLSVADAMAASRARVAGLSEAALSRRKGESVSEWVQRIETKPAPGESENDFNSRRGAIRKNAVLIEKEQNRLRAEVAKLENRLAKVRPNQGILDAVKDAGGIKPTAEFLKFADAKSVADLKRQNPAWNAEGVLNPRGGSFDEIATKLANDRVIAGGGKGVGEGWRDVGGEVDSGVGNNLIEAILNRDGGILGEDKHAEDRHVLDGMKRHLERIDDPKEFLKLAMHPEPQPAFAEDPSDAADIHGGSVDFDFGANESVLSNRRAHEGKLALRLDGLGEMLGVGLSAKGIAAKWLLAAGNLPSEVFKLAIAKDGQIGAYVEDIRNANNDLRKSLGGTYNSLPAAGVEWMNKALEGDPTALASLPPNVQTQIAHMRGLMDSLSSALIRIGAVTGPLAVKVDANLGTYLHRAYRAFSDPKWYEKVDPQVRSNFQGWLRAERQRLGLSTDQAHLDGVTNKLLRDGTAADNPIAFLSSRGLGDKDMSILMRRGDPHDTLRALWGEVKDPIANFTESAYRQAHLLVNHSFQLEVIRAGMDKFLAPANEPSGELIYALAAKGDQSMGPLAGLNTTKEIRDAFDEMYSPAVHGAGVKLYLKAMAVTKHAKTVGNPIGHVRNGLGNLHFVVANGHWRLGHTWAAIEAFTRDTPASRAAFRRMVELGVIGDGVHEGAFKKQVSDTFALREYSQELRAGTLSDRNLAFRLGRLVKVAGRLYRAEDGVFKVFAWLNEAARYKEAFPNVPIREIEQGAADRVRETYPSESMVPKWVKASRNFPLTGDFPSFTYETTRASYATVKLAAKELRQPETRAIGATRLAGFLMAAGLTAATGMLTRWAANVTSEEDSAMRRYMPEWSRNSTLWHLGRGEDGHPIYIDTGNTDPNAYFGKIVMAAIEGDGWKDKTLGAANEAGKPYFFEESMLTSKILDALRNKRGDTGRPLYNEMAPTEQKWETVGRHVGEAFVPGAVDTGIATEKRIAAGKPAERELTQLGGQRVQDLDVQKGLVFKAKDYVEHRSQAHSLVNRVIKQAGPVSDDDLASAYRDAEAAHRKLFDAMAKDVAAAKLLGVKDVAIRQTLDKNGLSAEDVQGLMSGRYTPYRPKVEKGDSVDVMKRKLAVAKLAAGK